MKWLNKEKMFSNFTPSLFIRKYSSILPFISFIFLFTLFSALSPKFLSFDNIARILSWATELRVATLGMDMILRGLIYFITYGFVLPIRIYHPMDALVLFFINGNWRLINIGLIWYLLLAVTFIILLYYTSFGNHIMATGGNPMTALYSGVDVRKVKIYCFIITSLTATFSGLLAAARLRMGSPTSGLNMELEAIAAAVIGGVSLRGCTGSILGVVFGTLTISMIRSGLVLAGAPVYWYVAFVGLILVLVSAIQSLLRGVRK